MDIFRIKDFVFELSPIDNADIFTHRYLYVNGKPYIHFIKKGNICKMLKNCEGYGYLPYGEIMCNIESLNIKEIYSL